MISVLIPTRKRPHRLNETLVSILTTAKNTPEVLCYVADDDDSYDQLIAQTKNELVREALEVKWIRGPRHIMSDNWNALIPHASGDIFQLSADDVIYQTKSWDVEIEKAFAAVPDRILLAYADDLGPNGKVFATLPFVSRRWCDVVGYFTGPGFSADFSDTWPNDVAEMIGRKVFVDVKIEHRHWMWGKAVKDQVYTENLDRLARDNCVKQYADRLPERVRDADKLRAAIKQYAMRPAILR